MEGRTTRYVWDGNVVVHAATEGEPLITWEFEPNGFTPIAKVEGEKKYSVVTDHLGAPTALLDEAGNLAWNAQLDLYGVAHMEVEKTTCQWRWPGQYDDAETGLYYNRFRYYDPISGSYISQDPIGLCGGLNAYAYTRDPSQWFDPFGLTSCKAVTNKRNKALREFSNTYFRTGDTLLLLTRESLEHILRRHHPRFWDKSVKTTQTFFGKNQTVGDILSLIDDTIRANRNQILQAGAQTEYHIEHVVDGSKYVLGVMRGHIGKFYTK
jgi:RHS repeat-associated protein